MWLNRLLSAQKVATTPPRHDSHAPSIPARFFWGPPVGPLLLRIVPNGEVTRSRSRTGTERAYTKAYGNRRLGFFFLILICFVADDLEALTLLLFKAAK